MHLPHEEHGVISGFLLRPTGTSEEGINQASSSPPPAPQDHEPSQSGFLTLWRLSGAGVWTWWRVLPSVLREEWLQLPICQYASVYLVVLPVDGLQALPLLFR